MLSAHLATLSAELGLSCCADGFFHGPVMLSQSCFSLFRVGLKRVGVLVLAEPDLLWSVVGEEPA